ncbi:hypothetical protein [Microbispora bryophytorum]|uniref:Uncharacterized protein n=1 Tax=Microbispora bryophytorum subsp. camponoti TaxID=1677852 RepID=A0ABR8LDG2_9ACTN|nr:hypothetical protein [Microbispora camponoti]MBD3147555.1 hypothetical protein [Microbispora camponoti]
MTKRKGTAPTEGWRVMTSDAGRLWATRERPFSPKAEEVGAARTVDGDDLAELCRVIAEQESLAALASAP